MFRNRITIIHLFQVTIGNYFYLSTLAKISIMVIEFFALSYLASKARSLENELLCAVDVFLAVIGESVSAGVLK